MRISDPVSSSMSSQPSPALASADELRPLNVFRARVSEQYDRLARSARRDDPVAASARHWLRDVAMRMAMLADYEEVAQRPDLTGLVDKLGQLEDSLLALQELMSRYATEAAAGCPPDAGWMQARNEVCRYVQTRKEQVRALKLRNAG